MAKRIIIGTRKSPLSLCQTELVKGCLEKSFPGYCFQIKKITTTGDILKKWARYDKGIFVKEIEESLLKKEIDLGIHSMKDLPLDLPRGLKLAAITKRITFLDALVSEGRIKLDELAKGALIGTSSLRRRAQLLNYRDDLKLRDLRGNLDTRLKKLKKGDFAAIVVAACGLIRMGWQEMISEYIPSKVILPAVGQGSLGIEIREDDAFAGELAKEINDAHSFICISCERAMLKHLGGGCRVPVAGLAKIENRRLYLQGAVASLDGRNLLRAEKQGSQDAAESLGEELAKQLLSQGAREILEELKSTYIIR